MGNNDTCMFFQVPSFSAHAKSFQSLNLQQKGVYSTSLKENKCTHLKEHFPLSNDVYFLKIGPEMAEKSPRAQGLVSGV